MSFAGGGDNSGRKVTSEVRGTSPWCSISSRTTCPIDLFEAAIDCTLTCAQWVRGAKPEWEDQHEGQQQA
ncbi:MAG: hypothetical protein ACXW37_12125, partial [Nitrospira sp.]